MCVSCETASARLLSPFDLLDLSDSRGELSELGSLLGGCSTRAVALRTMKPIPAQSKLSEA